MSDDGANHRSDVGRRVALRREQLGLSRERVAKDAGIAVEYLRYLEERAASPSVPSLTRVARALRTTVGELSGSEARSAASTPGGRGGELAELSARECRELLAAHNIGRVAVDTPQGPAIVPVNYALVDDSVVFRTEPGATPSFAEGEEVAFEVDRLDEALRVGWSVMVSGPARAVTDPAEVEELSARVRGGEPWVSGERNLWLRVAARRLSGRRVPLG